MLKIKIKISFFVILLFPTIFYGQSARDTASVKPILWGFSYDLAFHNNNFNYLRDTLKYSISDAQFLLSPGVLIGNRKLFVEMGISIMPGDIFDHKTIKLNSRYNSAIYVRLFSRNKIDIYTYGGLSYAEMSLKPRLPEDKIDIKQSYLIDGGFSILFFKKTQIKKYCKSTFSENRSIGVKIGYLFPTQNTLLKYNNKTVSLSPGDLNLGGIHAGIFFLLK